MDIEILDNCEAVVDGKKMGMSADVIVNHLDSVSEAPTPAESLSHRVARALQEKAAAALEEARQAREEAAEARQYIPATDDEIEKAAQAEVVQRQKRRAIQKRADELDNANKKVR